MTYNERKVKMELRRKDLCDLLIATTIISNENEGDERWDNLHDELKSILDKWDEEHTDLLDN